MKFHAIISKIVLEVYVKQVMRGGKGKERGGRGGEERGREGKGSKFK